MIGLRTLVLNYDYMPISLFPLHTIPVEDAVTRICNDTCRIVFEYDRKILTPSVNMKWPSVIARIDVKKIKENVKLRPEALYYRDHGVCMYCEKKITLHEMTCDHVYPKSYGGKYEWTNIVSACPKCNYEKGSSLPVGRWKPKQFPIKPTYYQLLEIRKKFPIVIDHESWIDFLSGWKSDIIVRAA